MRRTLFQSGSSSDTEKSEQDHLNHAGYYTVPVTETFDLAGGERFTLIVHITTEGADKPVAGETAKDEYTVNVSLENREGYISLDGVLWDETESVYAANICLKAYTDDRN